MKAHVVALASVVAGTTPAALAQFIHDPPWNAEHINHLPAEIRGAVLAKCPTRPDAGHYFATYYHDEVHLHFEHLHCGGQQLLPRVGLPSRDLSVDLGSLPAGRKHLQIRKRLGRRNEVAGLPKASQQFSPPNVNT